MRRKFGLDFVVHDAPGFREQGAQAWSSHDRIIAPYHTAKREPHRAAILKQDWDLVIVDEVQRCWTISDPEFLAYLHRRSDWKNF